VTIGVAGEKEERRARSAVGDSRCSLSSPARTKFSSAEARDVRISPTSRCSNSLLFGENERRRRRRRRRERERLRLALPGIVGSSSLLSPPARLGSTAPSPRLGALAEGEARRGEARRGEAEGGSFDFASPRGQAASLSLRPRQQRGVSRYAVRAGAPSSASRRLSRAGSALLPSQRDEAPSVALPGNVGNASGGEKGTTIANHDSVNL
jgi:hypothetical protein